MASSSSSSLLLSPPPISCSLPEPHNRLPSLRYPFKAQHQGNLIFLSSLSSSSFCTQNSISNLFHINQILPTKPFHHHFIKSNQRNQRNQVLVNENGNGNGEVPTTPNQVLVNENENGEIPTTQKFDTIIFDEDTNTIPIGFELVFPDFVEIKSNKPEKVEILGSNETNGRLQVMGSSEKIRRLLQGKEGIKDGKISSVEDFNNLLVALVKEDDIDEPQLLVKMFNELLPSYDGLFPDSNTFSIMIMYYCKRNEPEEAKRVLDEMLRNGFQPNVVTFTTLINSFCRRGKLKKAYEVFEVMGKVECEPNVQTYNCLINGLCYVGRVEEAFELLTKIKKSAKKKPDIYTYTAVMDGFCKVGRSDEAMELLEEALEDGLEPNAVTFNTLFNGYCKEGRPLDGISLLKLMRVKNCQPDYISYSTLLHGLVKWNEAPAALQVYQEMLEIGFQVNERLVNNLLRVICRKSWTNKELVKDVVEVFDRMKKSRLVPFPNTYCLVIQALSIGGEASKAKTTLQEMIQLGFRPSFITFHAVMRSLCKNEMVDESLLVLVLMIYRSSRPSRMSYNLMIDEFNRRGRHLDASKVYGAALKRGLVPSSEPRRKMIEE